MEKNQYDSRENQDSEQMSDLDRLRAYSREHEKDCVQSDEYYDDIGYNKGEEWKKNI